MPPESIASASAETAYMLQLREDSRELRETAQQLRISSQELCLRCREAVSRAQASRASSQARMTRGAAGVGDLQALNC